MVLPDQFFNKTSNLPSEVLPIEEGVDLTDKINSGNIDMEAFEDKAVIDIPQSTISPAPRPQNIPTKEEQPSNDIKNNGPSDEEMKRLESIESMLMDLEGQIKNISEQESNKSDEPKKSKSELILDEKLKEPLAGDGSKIEVLPQQNLNFNTTNQNETKIINDNKIKEFITQKETLLKERDNILQNFNKSFFNTEDNNTALNNTENNSDILNNIQNSIDNKNITSKNENNESNLKNIFNKDIKNERTENFAVENFAQSLLNETQKNINYNELGPQPYKDQPENNNTNILNNEFNSLIENITKESNIQNELSQKEIPQPNSQNEQLDTEIKTTQPTQQLPDIEFPEAKLTTEMQEQELAEAFDTKGNTVENKLPSPSDAFGENAKTITGLLEGIKDGVIKLNEGLGSKFSKLSESMQSMKSSIVNNSYSNSQNNTQNMNSNKISQRNVIPDYRGDYPDPGDFPKGFDVSKLGGTNLPNPPSII
jgi:hypothetical protein